MLRPFHNYSYADDLLLLIKDVGVYGIPFLFLEIMFTLQEISTFTTT